MEKLNMQFIKRVTGMSMIVGMACIPCGGLSEQLQNLQPWQQPYKGAEAGGPKIIGLWQFDQGTPEKDSSGNNRSLQLRGGTVFNTNGLFGGCLESFAATPENKPNGAVVAAGTNLTGLTPKDAFTLELWLKLKQELKANESAVLLDKMYISYSHKNPQTECQRDYMLRLEGKENGSCLLEARLGFGTNVMTYVSQLLKYEKGKWYHAAFTYDGQGKGSLFRNGLRIGGKNYPGYGVVVGGSYPLVIGDRGCSSYTGFPGYIDQVRISEGIVPFTPGDPASRTSLFALNRTSFVRMESNAVVELTVVNNCQERMKALKLDCELTDWQGKSVSSPALNLPDLPSGEDRKADFNLDTGLRPGDYTLKARVKDKDGVIISGEISGEECIPIAIVPRPLPLRMPVVMWGWINVMYNEQWKLAKELGFTHSLEGGVDYKRIWQAGKPTDPASPEDILAFRKTLNKMLKEDFGIVGYLYPGRMPNIAQEIRLKYQQIDRGGKPYKQHSERDDEFRPCALFADVQSFCYNVGASYAQAYGSFPASQGVLNHSELRDHRVKLCFHDHDYDAYRKATGRKIRGQPTSKYGIPYRSIPDFPAKRVVPENDPFLTYYRWFWKNGDGWNILQTETQRGIKSAGHKNLWTWHDPAVRAPSIWGSGGNVDVISQWTYSYPDPIKIGQATDELFAMADGNPGQQVMTMTQLIWYRNKTAPKPKAGEETNLPPAPWELIETNANSYITIAPDSLREAFWSKISRPVRGIMYHGWQSLVPGFKTSYCYTNPKTQNVFQELTRDVVKPLGPTLLQVPDGKQDVALLESFASQMFASRGTHGWGWSWEADMHLILQYARLQPKIIYDETILRDGLDKYKILVMPYCDVLSKSVFQAITRFQKRGGIIVADEFLCPALTPNILIPSSIRSNNAEKDKGVLQQRAADLRKELDAFYARYADSSNPDVIVRVRRYAGTDYVFLVNDRREYGDYVGQHRLVMEKGLPAQAEITLARTGGFIYDLVAGKETPSRVKDGKMQFKVDLGPGGGGIFMVTDQAIGAVKITAGDRVKLGKSMPLNVEVEDKAGNVMTGAVIPVEIRITDAEDRAAEFSGYYGARDGTVKINLDIAGNEKAGNWKITARELASGKKAEAVLQVEH